MGVGAAERLHHVLAVHVVGPGHEAGLGAQRQAERVEGVLERAERRRLGDLGHLRRRRVLALGETVDLVVEQQDGDVDVASQGVDQVVAADGEGVAVAGDDPHVEVRAGGGQAGGDGRGPAVDGVHPVGVHVVREPGGAPDARQEHGGLPAHAELGHQHLDGGQDRVVTAPGAPPDLLVRGPVLAGGERHGHGVGHVGHRSDPSSSSSALRSAVSSSINCRMAVSMAAARNGMPDTWVRDRASTRYSARSRRLSWPRLTSGTSTRL